MNRIGAIGATVALAGNLADRINVIDEPSVPSLKPRKKPMKPKVVAPVQKPAAIYYPQTREAARRVRQMARNAAKASKS
jgi:hypothetical protein